MYFVFLLISFAHFFFKDWLISFAHFFLNEQFNLTVFKIKKGEEKERSIFLLPPICWSDA